MAGIKQRGIISDQRKRYFNGEEVKPVKYYNSNGRAIMTGSVNDEIIRYPDGRPIPFKSI
jgi:hypothetical protein